MWELSSISHSKSELNTLAAEINKKWIVNEVKTD